MNAGRAPLPIALARPPQGRVLCFSPHADDDIIGPGGTLALHAAQGDPVRIVIVYDGLEGDPQRRYEPSAYRELRQREARAAGAHLGLSDYVFWSYPEGHLPGPGELLQAAERIAACVREYAADIVYAPWVGEQHVDHHVLARAVRLGLERAAFRGSALGFEVWTPLIAERVVDISALYATKVRALREHRSQLEYTDIVHKGLALSAQRSIYLEPAARHGEAFAELGPPCADDLTLLRAR